MGSNNRRAAIGSLPAGYLLASILLPFAQLAGWLALPNQLESLIGRLCLSFDLSCFRRNRVWDLSLRRSSSTRHLVGLLIDTGLLVVVVVVNGEQDTT